MNRRSFLTRLGVAAVGATALALDPDMLLWVPGAKTIIDFGATKHVVPATDAEVFESGYRTLLAAGRGGKTAAQKASLAAEAKRLLDIHREVRLDIGTANGFTSFHYKGGKLVSVHSGEELKLLDTDLRGKWLGLKGEGRP